MATSTQELQLLQALQAGQDTALDALFKAHYSYLCQSVYRVLADKHIAEDLVQEVFYELWRKRQTLNIKQGFRPYLRRAAINKTLNYIRAQKLVVDDESAMPIHLSSHTASAQEDMQAGELKEQIKNAIDQLPERCRLIFTLSRHENMSNKDIAQHLGISIKTVENQMTKALKLLKAALSAHLLSCISIFFTALYLM